MNNEQLRSHVLAGNTVTWADAYTLRAVDDRFIMERPATGARNTLSIEQTDAYRLAAHWHGFTGRLLPRPDAPMVRAGDTLEVWSNQAYRDATVLAVLGDEALVEYYMEKSGTSALQVMDIVEGDIAPGNRPFERRPRSVSYKRLPGKWIAAMHAQGMTHWIGQPQQSGGRRVEFPA